MTNLEKLYCYRGEDGDLEPKKMECLTEFGYPNLCVDEDGEGLSPDSFQEYIHNRFVEISMQSECLINAPTFKEKLTIVYNYHKNQTAPSGDGGEKQNGSNYTIWKWHKSY